MYNEPERLKRRRWRQIWCISVEKCSQKQTKVLRTRSLNRVRLEVQAYWENQARVERSDEKKRADIITTPSPDRTSCRRFCMYEALLSGGEPTALSIEGRRSHLSFPATTKSVCVGAQHKSKPHLHLRRTRDVNLNNDNRPTPNSFTAGINKRASDLGSACAVIESRDANEAGGAGGPPDRRRHSTTFRHKMHSPTGTKTANDKQPSIVEKHLQLVTELINLMHSVMNTPHYDTIHSGKFLHAVIKRFVKSVF